MSFLPGSLTPALLRSCHCKVISHSDGHSVVGCKKQKEPITQSIRNRREHSSRFKVMFYVIGSENQSRVLFSTAPANRTKGVVEQFGISGVPIPCRMKPTYGGTLVFSCLCSGLPLCHHYTDTSLIRQVSECLSLYSEFQRAIFNGCRKRSLYWLGHLGTIYQRVLKKDFKKLSQVVAAGNVILGSDLRKISPSGSRRERHF